MILRAVGIFESLDAMENASIILVAQGWDIVYIYREFLLGTHPGHAFSIFSVYPQFGESIHFSAELYLPHL